MCYCGVLKVLKSFTKYILSCEITEDWNEPMAQYIVNLFLDHYNELLQVPSSLIDHIKSRLHQKKLSQKHRLSLVRYITIHYSKVT